MGIIEKGIKAERKALEILKKFKFKCFQPDWIAFKNGKYSLIEVKGKERFEPPPFEGTVLEIYQVDARMKFYKETGIRPFLLVEDNELGWIGQWLDILEKGKKHDTKNAIRIYPIKNFKVINK